jgi:type IV secretion system protein VirD4
MCSVAAADHGMEDAGFWYASAEKLLAPLLFAAATAGTTMSDVVRWIDDEEMEEPLLALELAAVPDATRAARTSFAREDRERASVFSTAETVVAAFSDPGVAASASRASLDPRSLAAEGLREGARTLYCCAPAREQERLRPVFTALVREALDGAFESAAKRGGTLEPGLLVVLDEAANIAPLADLDGLAATCAGHGVQLLTVWQDMAQIGARYGPRAGTVLNNHRAKVFLSGTADAATLEHASRLLGEEEPVVASTTRDPTGGLSTTRSPSRRPLLPPERLRQLPPGSGVLVYGHLPPLRLVLRPWWDDPELAGRGSRPG